MTEMVQRTKELDDEESRKKFKRAFLLYIQKSFLCATTCSKLFPSHTTTIFDVSRTSEINWAAHVHNFLLDNISKFRERNKQSIDGCRYMLVLIYFNFRQYVVNLKSAPEGPWVIHWTKEMLIEKIHEESKLKAGLILQGNRKRRMLKRTRMKRNDINK
ncbi:hypothetical protein PIB30_017622 [Stylosanthes scabra]|uniref:Uncharacterized protein n=1 Tax=Stylosanthes scabra TaxID=79078 RepID=A0ABU6V9B0_9FABA|nr:hypothetical protein [Stylosanthes scabra]